MLSIIMDRGLLSMLGGHVLWTAMVGAALWKVRGESPFHFELLKDPSFLRVFLLAVVLHMIWNLPFTLPFYAKYVAVGFAAWVVIIGFIQEGLTQIRREQERQRTRDTVPPAGAPAVAV
jgi:RsiW-degrading membrane proteinase PrsW (M82 family)